MNATKRVIWRSFLLVCSSCGHRNRPHNSPRMAIRLTLTGKAGQCKTCGKALKPSRLSYKPLTLSVRAELLKEKVTTVC